MNRETRLKYCKVCVKQSFDAEKGIICSLTEKQAEFENDCDNFKEDSKLKRIQEIKSKNKEIWISKLNRKNKHWKLMLSHLLIFMISIFGFTNLYEYVGNGTFEMIYAIFHLTIVLILYFFSGFLVTNKTEKFEFSNYYIIALIGFIIWLFAVLNSPTDLNWKDGNGGISWLIYRMYIGGIEVPFNFSSDFSIHTKNIKLEIGILLILTIIPSILQAFGGFIKTNRSKKTLPNTV
tara:strand:+ start:30 stop:734 length:705 start_codon:yes stop_codon:yes gene_type:complete